MTKLHRLILLLLFVAGCGGSDETELGALTAGEALAKATDRCDPVTAEEQTLLSFASKASFETLDNTCKLESDAAAKIVRAAGSGFRCIEELASVAQVGNYVLQQLLTCGKKFGVSPSLYVVWDQPTSRGYDNAVAFTLDQAEQTVRFVDNASQAELEAVVGIGPALTAQLISGRPHASAHEIYWTSGIGVARMEALKAAALSWTGPAPAPSPTPAPGGYTLTAEAAAALTNEAVSAFMAANGEALWANNGYWVYGGEAFTDDWSKSYFLRKIDAYLRDDSLAAVQAYVGTTFESEATAHDFIGDLVVETLVANFDLYMMAYAEAIGEASA